MAIGSAARWAKSGCTNSSEERRRRRRRRDATEVSYIKENAYCYCPKGSQGGPKWFPKKVHIKHKYRGQG